MKISEIEQSRNVSDSISRDCQGEAQKKPLQPAISAAIMEVAESLFVVRLNGDGERRNVRPRADAKKPTASTVSQFATSRFVPGSQG